jgi:hypothetical protein
MCTNEKVSLSDIRGRLRCVEWRSPTFSEGESKMKKILAAAFLAATAAAPLSSALAADVGVSIGISQPGVYGRIDIGRFPQPEVFTPQPVVIGRPVVQEPVYMWVPPEHRAHWRRYCGQYHACGVPVYFVRDEWYGRHVGPHAPPGHYERGYEPREWRDDRHDRHDDRREEHRDEHRDDHRR